MKEPPPSDELWKELYAAATEFKDLAPWTFMYDSDIFGVRNPVDGEVGYCCVMGKLGQHFALGVYQGSEGLNGYLTLQSGNYPRYATEALSLQKCLMASFEDRRVLMEEDVRIIGRLGLKFRGRNAWPLFRSYLPGYYPWFLTGKEAGFLAVCLLQAVGVCRRFKDDRKMLGPRDGNRYFVRTAHGNGQGLSWTDEWLQPAPLEAAPSPTRSVDLDRLRCIRERAFEKHGVWEVDCSYHPEALQKGGARPYHPLVVTWIARGLDIVLGFELVDTADRLWEFREGFLRCIESIGTLPEQIWVQRDVMFQLLEPITTELNIELRKVRRLHVSERLHAKVARPDRQIRF